MSSRRTTLILGGFAFVFAGLAWIAWDRHKESQVRAPGMAAFSVPKRAPGSVPPVMFESPAFAYTDQDGKPAGNDTLRGKIWIADFIFTNCGGACPKVTARMVQLQKELAHPDLRFVSFSVDPERDDPATLKKYAEKYNSGDPRWMLLRPPDRKAVINIAQRMAAVAKPKHGDDHDEIVHTDFFLLIDESGHVRGHYDSKQDADMQRLREDVKAILTARANDASGKGAAKTGA